MELSTLIIIMFVIPDCQNLKFCIFRLDDFQIDIPKTRHSKGSVLSLVKTGSRLLFYSYLQIFHYARNKWIGVVGWRFRSW